MTPTAAQPAAGPSPAGLVVLALLLAAVAYLFAVGQGRAPSPVDFGRLGMSKLRGHPDDTAGQVLDPDDDRDAPAEMPKRPTAPADDDDWDDPNGILASGGRAWTPAADPHGPTGRHPAPAPGEPDDEDDDLDVGPARTPRPERLQWLRDRHRPGDPIRARYKLKTDFYRGAAEVLGVDEKTIRRDIAHLTKARTRSHQP